MPFASTHLERTLHAMQALGFRFGSPAEIEAAHADASRLVRGDVASAEVMIRVQARSRCAVFLAGAPPVAAVSVIPLTARALPELAAGRFDGLAPPQDLIARPGEAPAAFYVWGAAGFTWRGRRLALAASLAFQREVHPHLPLFARAATADGERVLQRRMGARPSAGGLVCAPPRLAPLRAA
jgi:hypothetical protein